MNRSPWTPGTLAAAATSAALMAHQVAGKAVRDALFLSSFSAASLPLVMAAAAALSVGAVLLLSRSMARRSPAKLMPIVLGASALGLVLEWALGLVSPPVSAVAIYLHTTAFGPAMISIFWSLINERFDPHAAKRAVGWIASGGSFGGVLGALSVWRASWHIELPALVLFLAALHGICVVGALLIRAPIAHGSEAIPTMPPALGERSSALGLLRKTPFLRHLGLLVILSAVTSALLDYVFSARAAAAFGAGQPLLSFFALFWLAVSVLSLLFQVTLGRVAIAKLGVAANIAMLPGITMLGSALGIVVPGLTSTGILRGAEAAYHNTLFRSAYELFYTPLAEARKRPTKALIDVGFDRFGTVVGSGIVIATLGLAAQSSLSLLLAVVLVLGCATLPVAWRLHIDYRGALEQGLRDGAKGLDLPTIDRGSGSSALEEKESVARDELTERLEALRPGGMGALSKTEAPAPGSACEALRHPQPLIAQATELLSGDVERTRRALGAWPGSSMPIADFAIALLAHEELHRDAKHALRRVAPRITGQLVDALLDPAMDFVVRRRIPRVLGACASQRAADGLVAGIRDERFEVRYECGRALMKLTHRNADIVVSRERIVEAILAESQKRGGHAELEIDADEEDAPEPFMDLLVRDRIDRSLEHVFTILSLHLEREPLRLAFRALHHEDVQHRGTALEYLDTILPKEIRDAVWPLLGETGPLPTARPAEAILADLVRTTASERIQ